MTSNTTPAVGNPDPTTMDHNSHTIPNPTRNDPTADATTEDEGPKAYEITPIVVTNTLKRQLEKYFPDTTPTKRTTGAAAAGRNHTQVRVNNGNRPSTNEPEGVARTERVEVHNQ